MHYPMKAKKFEVPEIIFTFINIEPGKSLNFIAKRSDYQLGMITSMGVDR